MQTPMPTQRQRSWAAWRSAPGLGLLCAVALAGAAPPGETATAPPPGPSVAWEARLYDVTIETGMPHLDESLRYATVRVQRCLGSVDLAEAFPVLQDVSLQDCRLVPEMLRADAAGYRLACTGGHGTAGGADWQRDAASLRGTLHVKLGGKNMTFYQRITALARGRCVVPEAEAAR